MAEKFIGSFSRSLDSKGRLLLPPKYLEALDVSENGESGSCGSFWLTCFYGRLVAYLPRNWENIVEQLSRTRFPSPKLAHFKTKIIGLAQEICPDNQGRIRLPQSLIREADLKKDIMLVGMLDKFEIWDQARFDALCVEDVFEELSANGIEVSL